MATLVFTAVGRLVGGPVGGAIGALIGNRIDRSLFGGGRAEGPRLGDLSIQTSSYGTAIPRLYGRMRVAGTVIWSTDLVEDRHKEGGGKGQPKAASYSYSVSFAVALSGRPIRAVGRIWADGKLLRGGAGDWKSAVAGFRLHPGGVGEAADPLIAAIEGAGATPAWDDLAYVVFEGLQLADFGNRIPSLTFEVIADDGAVTVPRIAADLTGGMISGEGTGSGVRGYAATGDSARAALEDLATAFSLSLCDAGGQLVLADDAVATALAPRDLGAASGSKRAPALSIDRAASSGVADEVQLSYYDPDRDWGAGLQRARGGRVARRTEAVALAAALSAAEAKTCAERRLATIEAGRVTGTATLGLAHLDLRAGGSVSLPGDGAGASWRISRFGIEDGIVTLALAGRPIGTGPAGGAEPGRAANDPDLVQGATTIHLLDLPALDGALLSRPRLLIAAAGVSPGWRAADLVLSLDDGASWGAATGTALPATMGHAETVLAPGGGGLIDAARSVTTQLLNDRMWLADADDDALAAGANLILVGDEILQFGRADPLGGGRFLLSRLLRGRLGSEAAAATHLAGERVVLLERDTLLTVDLPASAIGASIRAMASGLGDPAPVTAALVLAGRSVRPPAPVALSATRRPDGATLLGWTRRSRLGEPWLDGSDAPLGEESERYAVTVTAANAASRTVTVTASGWTYAAADQETDGAIAPFTCRVVQLGTLAASDPSLPFLLP